MNSNDSLDGKYFDAVHKDDENVHLEPVVIRIPKGGNTVEISFPNLRLKPNYQHILRLKIIIDDISVHSNVLMFDTVDDTVYRFEPLSKKDDLYHLINRVIQEYLHRFFPSFSYISANGSQSEEEGSCMAHCIRWVLQTLGETADNKIKDFSDKVVQKYKNAIDWKKPVDAEYGPWHRGGYGGAGYGYGRGAYGGYGSYGPWYGGGAAGLGLGVIGGTLIGGAIAGPGGALAGGLLGGAAGYSIGRRW